MSTLVLKNVSKEQELRILKIMQGNESGPEVISHNGWAIIRRADKGEDLGISVLALVDRRMEKKLWWISDDTNKIMKFNARSAAEFQLKKYRYGNPQVVPYDIACELIQEQSEEIAHHDNNFDPGDDMYWAEKDWK